MEPLGVVVPNRRKGRTSYPLKNPVFTKQVYCSNISLSISSISALVIPWPKLLLAVSPLILFFCASVKFTRRFLCAAAFGAGAGLAFGAGGGLAPEQG